MARQEDKYKVPEVGEDETTVALEPDQPVRVPVKVLFVQEVPFIQRELAQAAGLVEGTSVTVVGAQGEGDSIPRALRALEEAHENGEPFDVVISGVYLAGNHSGGFDLLREVRQRGLASHTVLYSEYAISSWGDPLRHASSYNNYSHGFVDSAQIGDLLGVLTEATQSVISARSQQVA